MCSVTSTPPSVFVVDDDSAVLASVEALLSASGMVVESFSSVKAFFDKYPVLPKVGCIVTDLRMEDTNGLQFQEELSARDTTLGLVVVTAHATVAITVKIMERGAVTLLEKPYEPAALVDSVHRAILHSESMFQAKKLKQEAIQTLSQLTEEELKVMQRAVAGVPNKTIAKSLMLSLRTVERRRQTAMEKLNIASVAEFATLLNRCEN